MNNKLPKCNPKKPDCKKRIEAGEALPINQKGIAAIIIVSILLVGGVAGLLWANSAGLIGNVTLTVSIKDDAGISFRNSSNVLSQKYEYNSSISVILVKSQDLIDALKSWTLDLGDWSLNTTGESSNENLPLNPIEELHIINVTIEYDDGFADTTIDIPKELRGEYVVLYYMFNWDGGDVMNNTAMGIDEETVFMSNNSYTFLGFGEESYFPIDYGNGTSAYSNIVAIYAILSIFTIMSESFGANELVYEYTSQISEKLDTFAFIEKQNQINLNKDNTLIIGDAFYDISGEGLISSQLEIYINDNRYLSRFEVH